MKTLIVYDSAHGNTEKVAQQIALALGVNAKPCRVETLHRGSLADVGLLIVGSPTQAGQATPATRHWLASLPAGTLDGVQVAAFDTRLDFADQGFGLSALMKLIGYAAPRIHRALVAKGGVAAAGPAGFIVGGTEGPLRSGELEAAARWARELPAHNRAERDAA
jgi:flavodoxin